MTLTLEQFRLDSRVAVVTGAGARGSSIDRAYALGLTQTGAAVVVADMRQEPIRSAGDWGHLGGAWRGRWPGANGHQPLHQ